MVPFSHHVGELRAHYAGFFDPGFGYGREGELKGAVGVLEVRPHETITIYDGQVTHDMLLDYLRRRDHFLTI
jgi:dCTP deaminase